MWPGPRADLIADLAAEGYTSRQMPEKVGVTEHTVRLIARQHGIKIPADKVMGRARSRPSRTNPLGEIAVRFTPRSTWTVHPPRL